MVERFKPSLWDRLRDGQSDRTQDRAWDRTQSWLELAAAVGRDLEELLNTRRPHGGGPVSDRRLGRSLFNYGVTEPAAVDIGREEGRKRFLAEIRTAVELFEPRLEGVEVALPSPYEDGDRSLRFVLTGLLRGTDLSERLVFNWRVDPVTASIDLCGGGYR